MTSVLLAVVVILAIITLGNLVLLFAVIRRLRHVQDLVVPPALVPDVGTSVGSFAATTLAGASLTKDDLADGPVLVAVLSTTCPACRALAGDLVTLTGPQAAPVVFVVSDPQHDNPELVSALSGLERVALVTREHPALVALGGITAFPTLLVVREGQVTGSGTSLNKVLPALQERSRLAAR